MISFVPKADSFEQWNSMKILDVLASHSLDCIKIQQLWDIEPATKIFLKNISINNENFLVEIKVFYEVQYLLRLRIIAKLYSISFWIN